VSVSTVVKPESTAPAPLKKDPVATAVKRPVLEYTLILARSLLPKPIML
jgi:hypothetical protein